MEDGIKSSLLLHNVELNVREVGKESKLINPINIDDVHQDSSNSNTFILNHTTDISVLSNDLININQAYERDGDDDEEEEEEEENELYNSSMSSPLLDKDNDDEKMGVTILDKEGKPVSLSVKKFDEPLESVCKTALEVFFPYIIGGFGMVMAGYVLDKVQDWDVFKNITEVFILVPALLGLKGNLEMTLASRLSTQWIAVQWCVFRTHDFMRWLWMLASMILANLGNMDCRREQWKMIYGNLALTQVQAIVVGLLASIFAILLGWIPSGKLHIMHGFLMCAGSVLTAVLATLILGSLMVGVVLFSRRFHINPDNVATPIAASLGDLTTISLLALICQSLYKTIDFHLWLTPTLLCALLLLIPLWWYVSHRNKYTHDVLYSGWVPVIGAMVISSLGGLVLDYAVKNYVGLAIFQPVINGVGGNLVAVQASRLSTALHKVSSPGTLPENAVRGCPNPITTFFSNTSSSRTARVLMMMVVPGHAVFMALIYVMQQTGDFVFSIPFALMYLCAALLQVAMLLYIANGLVHFLWARGNDPDNSSIPYLTAIGDLLGTSLLALTFLIVSKLQPEIKH